jgi:glutathione synthase/RimK-type ligase-like ATP-grasp enzyme
MISNHLGIMVCESQGLIPFQEKKFYQRLCIMGTQLKMQVFVFSPLRINWSLQQVTGYTFDYKKKQWLKKYFPLPRLIYDRCFYNDKKQITHYRYHINKLRKFNNVQFLGHGLKGKWTIQQTLIKNPLFQPYLPYSERYIRPKSILPWMKHKGEVFLKPQGGSHGKGVLHIARLSKHQYSVKGRDMNNRSIDQMFNEFNSLLEWVEPFINSRKYILQDYLTLTSTGGEAFDIRSLMQKNSEGQWEHTGMAVRRGQPGSITSNLHGGGSAEEALPFLINEYGREQAKQIYAAIQELSHQIPPYLEQQHGRLIELGIDFGIDQQGRVWILEVNSKPGRAVFLYLRNINQKKSSIRNPIHYARYILDRQLGG